MESFMWSFSKQIAQDAFKAVRYSQGTVIAVIDVSHGSHPHVVIVIIESAITGVFHHTSLKVVIVVVASTKSAGKDLHDGPDIIPVTTPSPKGARSVVITTSSESTTTMFLLVVMVVFHNHRTKGDLVTSVILVLGHLDGFLEGIFIKHNLSRFEVINIDILQSSSGFHHLTLKLCTVVMLRSFGLGGLGGLTVAAGLRQCFRNRGRLDFLGLECLQRVILLGSLPGVGLLGRLDRGCFRKTWRCNKKGDYESGTEVDHVEIGVDEGGPLFFSKLKIVRGESEFSESCGVKQAFFHSDINRSLTTESHTK
jgi:hypothetical protein